MIAPLVDLSVHHAPKGRSDRTARGFVKALRFFADTFLAERYGHRAVVLMVCADEAHHRDVNHGFIAPCPPHVELLPAWKAAA